MAWPLPVVKLNWRGEGLTLLVAQLLTGLFVVMLMMGLVWVWVWSQSVQLQQGRFRMRSEPRFLRRWC